MSTLLRILTSLLVATITACASAPQRQNTFVFVKIIEAVEPLERARKYEDPLGAALKKASLGEVTGGGSLLSREKRLNGLGLTLTLN